VSNNYVQEVVVMGSVHLNMKVGEHEIKGVLYEMLHVPILIKNIFQLVRLLLKASRYTFNRKNVGRMMLKK
jgi:hypothetical protein